MVSLDAQVVHLLDIDLYRPRAEIVSRNLSLFVSGSVLYLEMGHFTVIQCSDEGSASQISYSVCIREAEAQLVLASGVPFPPPSSIDLRRRPLALSEVNVPLALTCRIGAIEAVERLACIGIHQLKPPPIIVPRVESVAYVCPFIVDEAVRESKHISEVKGTRLCKNR